MTYNYLLILIIIYVIKIICRYFKQKNELQMESKTNLDSSKLVDPINQVNQANQNNQTDKIIVSFRGDKYDITDFLRKHPGGKNVLIKNNGKDIEELMAEYEHSKNAYLILSKYKITEK